MRDSSPMMSQRLMNLGKEARIEPLVDGNLHFTAAAFQRTPNRAYSAPTSALIACAAAISDLEPAALPFLDLAKPRPYNALGSLGSRFSAASKSAIAKSHWPDRRYTNPRESKYAATFGSRRTCLIAISQSSFEITAYGAGPAPLVPYVFHVRLKADCFIKIPNCWSTIRI
jgi:hypothetical protein